MDKQLYSPWLMAGSALAFALLFLAVPQLDLWVGGWLYAADRGFLLRSDPVFDFVHEYIGVLGWLLCIGAGLYWLLARGGERTLALRMKRRAAAYVALALLLGPGLMVNVLFKDQWGRARPGQVTEFGGTARFTPAWIPSDHSTASRRSSSAIGRMTTWALSAGASGDRRERLPRAALRPDPRRGRRAGCDQAPRPATPQACRIPPGGHRSKASRSWLSPRAPGAAPASISRPKDRNSRPNLS